MTNLTCFWHPKMGYHDLSLDDKCTDCDRTMRYPLDNPPVRQESLRDFKIVKAIDRGFYSATYVAEQGIFGQRLCLKVIPAEIYRLRGKSFTDECRTHHEVARGTQHLVAIRDAFDAEILFAGEDDSISCHVAVLDYVSGQSLREVLEQDEPISAQTTAQIALDLLRLLQELERKQVFHNDLHAGNILVQQLEAGVERGAEAIDPYTRAVAVDLGSIRDESRSDEAAQIADSHQVTGHLMRLALRLLPDPVTAADTDFRLAVALNEIADFLKPDNVTQRTPNYDDLMSNISAAFVAASSPWKKPTEGLRRFGDAFNAQTMRPWFVPRLLVDPDGEWQRRIGAAGPLVVTGMRGCGKTMLLRSLQFHARASGEEGEPTSADVLDRLRQDGYVGLYVSCNRLLDGLGKPKNEELHEPYTRLFLCYAREALQAIRHLVEIGGRDAVIPVAPRPIAETIAALVSGSTLSGNESVAALERRIHEMLRSLESGGDDYRLTSNPTIAMPQLATAVTQCSEVWAGAQVLFLLDDVSTRHLHEESIRKLLSTLMFASDVCAFKVTTEAQTLELVLKSPGLVEKARIGRDYDAFDLASAIHRKLRESGGRAGREFVAQVLQHRANLLASHPHRTPREIMGDQPLVEIARNIVASTETSPDRKNVYFGMSALAAVCVGDIGDVISIYELILSRAGRVDSAPVASKVQSSAFQEFCSRRLYHLNRRQGRLKQFADGFANAAHDLLIESARRNPDRLRDYASIYVRVTTGDVDLQLQQLRELMDAGVFVLTGGPDAPRTKARDSDPLAQYTLHFRKLLGLSSAIGLSQRDRFELSGEAVEEWLNHPENSREILKRNLASGEAASTERDVALRFQGGTEVSETETTVVAGTNGGSGRKQSETSRRPRRSSPPSAGRARAPIFEGTLFDAEGDGEGVSTPQFESHTSIPTPSITEHPLSALAQLEPHTLVLGRGFEERAFVSVQRILAVTVPPKVRLVTYPLEGYGPRISELVESVGSELSTVASTVDRPLPDAPSDGVGLVDITGLSKTFIYRTIRELLQRDGRVLVVHTGAERHYPLNDDVAARLEGAPDDEYAQLDACHDILTGEQRPYHFVPLQASEVDDGRKRALLASTSAKHERLFSLLETRDYDHVEILQPPDNSPRSRLARLAASVAAHDYHSCQTHSVATDDPSGSLRAIQDTYEEFYARSNFNFEVGLTGSKMHAVAVAAASTAFKFSQVWYVQPDGFDVDRFTAGVGSTRAFLIEKA